MAYASIDKPGQSIPSGIGTRTAAAFRILNTDAAERALRPGSKWTPTPTASESLDSVMPFNEIDYNRAQNYAGKKTLLSTKEG